MMSPTPLPTIPAVVLESVSLSDEVKSEFERFRDEYAKTAPNLLNPGDYARWSVVLSKLPARASLLDVGVGVGQFMAAAANTGRFSRVHGLDNVRHSKFLDCDKVEMTYASATDMPFETGAFDFVTCLEVIEHLTDEDVTAAVAELRRVAKRGLFITVPYCEKEPLPSYHLQRFTYARIKKLFPKAKLTLCVTECRVPWIMIEERFEATPPETSQTANRSAGLLSRLFRRG